MTSHSVLWRGSYLPGHEACRLLLHDTEWDLAGTAVFRNDQLPCLLTYRLVCDSGWRTRSASVAGWLGNDTIDVKLDVDPNLRWKLNGVDQPQVSGCVDLDLNFSPSTNLLPIRRLNLAIGDAAEITAAWLRFPGFELEPLPQCYRRLDERTYRYESGGGQFVAELRVDEAGFVARYPGGWQAEATGSGR